MRKDDKLYKRKTLLWKGMALEAYYFVEFLLHLCI